MVIGLKRFLHSEVEDINSTLNTLTTEQEIINNEDIK